jgi:hypothetical protein
MKSQQRQGHIEAWKSSGMSQVAYCREQGLNLKTFGDLCKTPDFLKSGKKLVISIRFVRTL